MSTITCIETIAYLNLPFIYVALDDGNIHVRPHSPHASELPVAY
jgi:hypothetical protein